MAVDRVAPPYKHHTHPVVGQREHAGALPWLRGCREAFNCGSGLTCDTFQNLVLEVRRSLLSW